MARLIFETGHVGSRYHSNCAFPHLFRHCHALCIYAAVTGDAYWDFPFGSPARKRWDEASVRRFTPIPALWGTSRCSVFVTASYEIARIVARSNMLVKGFTVFQSFFLPADRRPSDVHTSPRTFRRCSGQRIYLPAARSGSGRSSPLPSFPPPATPPFPSAPGR